mmetsp:Transcript_25762/g.72100  ORF Transcript_25762/g.72100 Transcript_25762/m.72100 type:complete len:252 (-) Transcript_25762:3784-4539(-)
MSMNLATGAENWMACGTASCSGHRHTQGGSAAPLSTRPSGSGERQLTWMPWRRMTRASLKVAVSHRRSVRSSAALTRWPAGVEQRARTHDVWPPSRRSTCLLARSQTMTSLSSEPLARRLCGSRARDSTAPTWPHKDLRKLPLSGSHSRTVLSLAPLATAACPSGPSPGSDSTQCTVWVFQYCRIPGRLAWPLSSASRSPLSTSHTMMFSSAEPLTRRPSSRTVRQFTMPPWPDRVFSNRCSETFQMWILL